MDKGRFSQIKREAIATGIALLMLIIYWFVAGFGLSALDVRIAHLPLWAVAGTVGTWIFALVLVAGLLQFVFRDMPLDDAASTDASASETPSGDDGVSPRDASAAETLSAGGAESRGEEVRRDA